MLRAWLKIAVVGDKMSNASIESSPETVAVFDCNGQSRKKGVNYG